MVLVFERPVSLRVIRSPQEDLVSMSASVEMYSIVTVIVEVALVW